MKDSLYAECVARGIHFSNHESDLYIPVTPETRELCKHFGHQPQVFTNQVEGGSWYDVPFAFVPWWDKRTCNNFGLGISCDCPSCKSEQDKLEQEFEG